MNSSKNENQINNSNTQNTTIMKLSNTPTSYQNRRKNNLRSLKSKMFVGLACLSLVAISNNSFAQEDDHPHPTKSDIKLHENPLLGSCDFDISSDLTQSEWKRATREIGNILYLNPLSSARPLGQWKWDAQIEITTSDFDEHSGAWNNIFHHPDSTHYLSETDRISVPALRFRMGITDRIDAGIYYAPAQPFGANYGFLGLEAKYAFINDTEHDWAASVRASYVTDANIKDFNTSTTAIDVSASKTFWGMLTPYAGLSMNWNHSREVTDEVNLTNENYLGVRAIVGLEFKWKFVNLGYELMMGDGFNNRALKIGVTF